MYFKPNVVLTWTHKGQTFSEKVKSVLSEDFVYSLDGDYISMEVGDLSREGWSLFEDEEGLFSIKTDSIISIEYVEEG